MRQPHLSSHPLCGGCLTWLNTGEIEEVNLDPLSDKFSELLRNMELIWNGEKTTKGMRCGECSTCDWVDFCFETWKGETSVCLLYGVSGQTGKKFIESGFHSWRDVIKSNAGELASPLKTSMERARVLWLHAQAYARGNPEIIKLPDFPSGIPIHFYDVETYRDTVYLHGDIRLFEDSWKGTGHL